MNHDNYIVSVEYDAPMESSAETNADDTPSAAEGEAGGRREAPLMKRRKKKRHPEVRRKIVRRGVWRDLQAEAAEKPEMRSDGASWMISSSSFDVSVSSSHPFWRFTAFFVWMTSWIWNLTFFFLRAVLFESPLGIRAWLPREHFFTHKTMNLTTGVWEDAEWSSTETFWGLFKSLWLSIAQSRRDFESIPDTGIIGKSLTRVFHLFSCYVLWGLLGTLGILIFFPILSFLTISISLLLGLTTAIWVPVVALILWALSMVIVDVLYGPPYRGDVSDGQLSRMIFPIIRMIVVDFIALGLLNVVLSLVLSVVVYPLVSALNILFAFCRCSLRTMWDVLMFHLVLKLRGRVPATDSWVARRVSYPGIGRSIYYSTEPAIVFGLFQLHCESVALNEFCEYHSRRLKEPEISLQSLSRDVLSSQPWGGSFALDASLVKSRASAEAESFIDEERRQRQSRLRNLLSIARQCRLPKKDLDQAVDMCRVYAGQFYPEKVFPYLTQSKEEFWRSHSAPINGYVRLVEEFASAVLGEDFMVPLTEDDASVALRVCHPGFSNYCSRIATGSRLSDDLSHVVVEYRPSLRGRCSPQVALLSSGSFLPQYHIGCDEGVGASWDSRILPGGFAGGDVTLDLSWISKRNADRLHRRDVRHRGVDQSASDDEQRVKEEESRSGEDDGEEEEEVGVAEGEGKTRKKKPRTLPEMAYSALDMEYQMVEGFFAAAKLADLPVSQPLAK